VSVFRCRGRGVRPFVPLALLCLLLALVPGSGQSPRPGSRVSVLEEARAWQCLPAALQGGGQPLPAWARALAGPLPHTTAAMLELDFLHRARSPLEPKLRGRLRWVAAHANRCGYSEAYAAADLRRAGLDEAAVGALADPDRLPGDVQPALTFARKLTLAADTVTDAEVADLIRQYGEKQVVAMVLLLAHANFQDRLILALDVPLGMDEPLPPLDVRFTRPPPGFAVTTLGNRGVRDSERGTKTTSEVRAPAPAPEWRALDFNGIQGELEKQRARRCRIKLPADNLGSRWGLVCQTYQPELAAAWGACARAFGNEADQDPLLEASLFWVVTRSQRCFY
jgi:alkylhydroperoxidase family enzyme